MIRDDVDSHAILAELWIAVILILFSFLWTQESLLPGCYINRPKTAYGVGGKVAEDSLVIVGRPVISLQVISLALSQQAGGFRIERVDDRQIDAVPVRRR